MLHSQFSSLTLTWNMILGTMWLQYHSGYQEQMSRWPEQPVNNIVQWLQGRSSSLVVADFGCGELLNYRLSCMCSMSKKCLSILLLIHIHSSFIREKNLSFSLFIWIHLSAEFIILSFFLFLPQLRQILFSPFLYQVMHALQKAWRIKFSRLILFQRIPL